MFPATKKYPRPNLPLLRKRNKQREQRHMFVKEKTFWCRLKEIGYGDQPLNVVNRGGRPIPETRSLATLTGYYRPCFAAVGHKETRLTSNHKIGPDAHFSFLSFFLFRY